MIDFRELKGAKEFEQLSLPLLRAATEQFFGCKVSYSAAPSKLIWQQFGVDIAQNPHRGVYLLDSSKAVLLGRVLSERNVLASFSLVLEGLRIDELIRLLNVYESALALSLSRSYRFRFRDKPLQFGDELIELTIAKYFSKGYYDHRKLLFLIQLFHKLSTITFEGRHFMTGLILSRSHYAFAEKRGYSREGELLTLRTPYQLVPEHGVDKRFWYLADGQTSYYYCDRYLKIREVFLLSNARQGLTSFVNDYSLSETIRGGDALFRVTGSSEISITGAGNIDFNYKEGKWRIRDLQQIVKTINEVLVVDNAFVNALLFYAFTLSRRRVSSILWVPKDTTRIDEVLLTRNAFSEKSLSILDERHTQTLCRLLSSDGASVIQTDGSVISFGSVVDIAKVIIKGVKGTGESVSSLLAQNGIAIKVVGFPGSDTGK